jgi:hypothetical protein
MSINMVGMFYGVSCTFCGFCLGKGWDGWAIAWALVTIIIGNQLEKRLKGAESTACVRR